MDEFYICLQRQLCINTISTDEGMLLCRRNKMVTVVWYKIVIVKIQEKSGFTLILNTCLSLWNSCFLRHLFSGDSVKSVPCLHVEMPGLWYVPRVHSSSRAKDRNSLWKIGNWNDSKNRRSVSVRFFSSQHLRKRNAVALRFPNVRWQSRAWRCPSAERLASCGRAPSSEGACWGLGRVCPYPGAGSAGHKWCSCRSCCRQVTLLDSLPGSGSQGIPGMRAKLESITSGFGVRGKVLRSVIHVGYWNFICWGFFLYNFVCFGWKNKN